MKELKEVKIFANSKNKTQKLILSEFKHLLARCSHIFISNMAAPMNNVIVCGGKKKPTKQ